MFRSFNRWAVAGLSAAGLFGAATGIAQASAQVYQQALNSTVLIAVVGQNSSDIGSGALIDKQHRLVVTAYHVVAANSDPEVYFPARDESGQLITDPAVYVKSSQEIGIHGHVIASDSSRDIAIVQLDSVPDSAIELPLADQSAQPGDTIQAIGSSGISDGVLWRNSDGSVRQVYQNTLTYENHQVVTARMIEAQCPTNPGDSGGPLLNAQSQLVGVVVAESKDEANVEYGVDVSEVRTVLAQANVGSTATPAAPAADPSATSSDPAVPSAQIVSVTEEPDVTVDGERGLMIHAHLDINNSLGQPCLMEAILSDSTGKYLPASDPSFSTPDGAFKSASLKLVPRYADSDYQDAAVFIPYSQMMGTDTAPGVQHFQIAVDVWSLNGQKWITPSAIDETFTLTVN